MKLEPLTPKEIEHGIHFWRTLFYKHNTLDEWVKPLLSATLQNGWLKRVRHASNWSGRQVGSRMKMSASGYLKLEEAEEKGQITIETLKKCAEALDCEFVYGLRPKTGGTFAQKMAALLLPDSLNPPVGMAFNRATALAGRMHELSYKPAFRRKMGWAAHLTMPIWGRPKWSPEFEQKFEWPDRE